MRSDKTEVQSDKGAFNPCAVRPCWEPANISHHPATTWDDIGISSNAFHHWMWLELGTTKGICYSQFSKLEAPDVVEVPLFSLIALSRLISSSDFTLTFSRPDASKTKQVALYEGLTLCDTKKKHSVVPFLLERTILRDEVGGGFTRVLADKVWSSTPPSDFFITGKPLLIPPFSASVFPWTFALP